MATTRLTRDPDNALLGGVCAGIGARYDLDVTAVRIVTVVLTLAGGLGGPLYLAAWLLMPTPALVAEPPSRVTRANASDVVDTARRTASSLAHTNPEEVTDHAKRAAHEVGRVVEDGARIARDAFTRTTSRSGGATGAATAPPPPPAPSAPRAAPRPGGGFKPPDTSTPPSTPPPSLGPDGG